MWQGESSERLVWTRFNGPVAWLHVSGPWDAERVRTARDCFEEGRALQPPSAPWGLIVVVHASAACSPDALLSLRAAAQRDTRSEGRAATAWVLAPGLEGRSIMPVVLHAVYEGICPLAVCETEVEAERWLLAHLAGLRASTRG